MTAPRQSTGLLASVLFVLFVLVTAAVVDACHADAWDNTSIGVGPQYTWFSDNGAQILDEFELGGAIATSLRPLVTAVGSLNYGTDHNYWRTDVGLDFSTHDEVSENQHWSVGAALKRQFYSNHKYGADQWVATGAVGLATRVWGKQVSFGLLGAYGIKEEDFRTTASLTLPFKIAK